jgi:D-beta-D-heptose 7-phosphate kinase/D-beta-D-heptose 1-phosphate adenosyltransferase
MTTVTGGVVNVDQQELLVKASKIFKESGLLSDLSPQERIIDSLSDLGILVQFLKMFGAKIVLTMGTFDLFHVGHARYIRKARQNGSILIVGVDDDEKARGRKGENRPAVPYIERSELLGYLRHVDVIAKKSKEAEKWAMIKLVRPDVLIAVEGTYTKDEEKVLKEFCSDVVVLKRQAETSTSAKIRKMILDGADTLKKVLAERLPNFVEQVYEEMKGKK